MGKIINLFGHEPVSSFMDGLCQLTRQARDIQAEGVRKFISGTRVMWPEGYYMMLIDYGRHHFWTPVHVYDSSSLHCRVARAAMESKIDNPRANLVKHKPTLLVLSQEHLDTSIVFTDDVCKVYDAFLSIFQKFRVFDDNMDDVARVRIMRRVKKMNIDPMDDIGARLVYKHAMAQRDRARILFSTESSSNEGEALIDD